MGSKGVLQQTDQGLLLVNPRDGTAQPVLGPNGAPAGKPAALAKALPSSAAKGYLENLQNMERAQKALDLVSGSNVGSSNGDTEATGLKGYLPNGVLNRVDPEGVDARAALSDIGSMVIHDRSGAAVSATEFPRLQPFIPSVRDDAATVKKKLKLFVENYKAIVDDQAEFYRARGTTCRRSPAATSPPRRRSARAAACPRRLHLPREGMTVAKYKVQGPDGAIHVFEGPEGASQDQVLAFAQQHFGGRRAPPPMDPKQFAPTTRGPSCRR
jgi:hypothetical protein